MNFLSFAFVVGVGMLSFFLIGLWMATHFVAFKSRVRHLDQTIMTIGVLVMMFSWCVPGGVLVVVCVIFLGWVVIGFAFPT